MTSFRFLQFYIQKYFFSKIITQVQWKRFNLDNGITLNKYFLLTNFQHIKFVISIYNNFINLKDKKKSNSLLKNGFVQIL